MDAPRCPDCSGALTYDLTGLMVMCQGCGFTHSAEDMRKLYDADRQQFGLLRPSQRTPGEDARVRAGVKE